MTNKPIRRTRTSKTRSVEEKTPSRKGPSARQVQDQRAPIEHYHGEKTRRHVGDEGDLDEEVLDRDAPYNKTYGRMGK